MKEYIIIVDESKPDIMGGVPLMEQPKELIRCKDCKHFEPDGIYTMCYRHNGLSQNADWFCADGEKLIRKE